MANATIKRGTTDSIVLDFSDLTDMFVIDDIDNEGTLIRNEPIQTAYEAE